MTSVVLDTNIYDKIVERGMTGDLVRLVAAGRLPHGGTVPWMLAPGEYLLEYTEDLSVFDKPVKFLAAWDSLDRAHRCSRRDLKRILEQVRKASGPHA